MFKNILKVAFIILIICSAALCKPIKNNSVEAAEAAYQQNEELTKNVKTIDENETKRAKRQVVQPTWLSDTEIPNPFIDKKVRVTEENLREAAAIRKTIQSAVNAGTFAVDPGQPSDQNNVTPIKPNTFSVPNSKETTPPKSSFSFFPMKFPAFNMDFSMFQRIFQPFVSSSGNVAATKDASTAKTTKSKNTEFQKAWLEFKESAKKKWPAETANFQPFLASTANTAETETVAASKTTKSDNKPSNEFQKAWFEFMENSKQMVSSMPPADTAAEDEFIEQFDNLWTEFEDNFMKMWSVDLFV